MSLLVVKDLKKHFGGVKAVDGTDFVVKENSITSLIGPNGAGKTTVFNLITGLIKPDAGEIIFKGEPLVDLEPHEIFHLGIARTYQMLRIFPKLTVTENLMIAHPGEAERMFDSILRRKLMKDEEKTKNKRAMEYLKMVGILKKKDFKAGDLFVWATKIVRYCSLFGN